MLVRLLIALAVLCTLSYSYESPSSECLSVENGSLIGYIMPTFIALNISNVLELSCICETIGIDGIEAQSFRGVTGALLHGDCGALRYFAKAMATAWKERHDRGEESRSHFVYVETGSYMGLSTQIVTTTALSVGVPVISYAHDLFDSSTTELWDAAPQERSNLQNFYDNVRRNGLVSNIVPIIGQSWETMQIHEDNSVDLVFIDGDHTYEGALEDMREGFRILRPGGYLLGHDAVPESTLVYHGGMGWNGVTAALRQLSLENGWRRSGAEADGQCDDAWAVVLQTAHMFAILKA